MHLSAFFQTAERLWRRAIVITDTTAARMHGSPFASSGPNASWGWCTTSVLAKLTNPNKRAHSLASTGDCKACLSCSRWRFY